METIFQNPGATDLVMRAVILAVTAGVTLAVQGFVARGVRTALDRSSVPNASIFVNVVRAAIWSVALLLVLRPVFGVDPSGFVAALGVVSLTISLGLQDTISNVVGGLGLMLGRVVRPGDQISVNGVAGVVEDMTWRHTLLRDRSGTVAVIPNSVINKDTLTRCTRWSVTVASVPVVVAPTADLDAVTADVCGTVGAALAGRLDPEHETELVFSELTPQGYVGTINFHVTDGEAVPAARDAVVRSLAGRPWLARAVLDKG